MNIGVVTDELSDNLETALELAGITVCLENEHICWADGGRETSRLTREIGSAALKINWDPDNAFSAGGTPFPDGYQAARGLVGHVHVKDARQTGQPETARALEGEIGWAGSARPRRRMATTATW